MKKPIEKLVWYHIYNKKKPPVDIKKLLLYDGVEYVIGYCLEYKGKYRYYRYDSCYMRIKYWSLL